MSRQSNDKGRAYEYICLITLYKEINKIRKAEIIDNSAFKAAYNAWSLMTPSFQLILAESASAAIATIFDMEPMILEQSSDTLKLKIQTDNEGKEGVWNKIFNEYKGVIVGITGIGTLTMVCLFIFNFMKLGQSAGNPQARSQALTGLLWTGLAAAGLGGVTIFVGFSSNLLRSKGN